ncbi:MAG: MFS transporter [Cyanobacteria bacterium SZAS LIN-5]|nr:MFS transporter [Cyanobacteria bacterium SZAS LIN-5]RTL38742.1 MAG: MFS transporter [Candidatus Melainabacteria bacterium]
MVQINTETVSPPKSDLRTDGNYRWIMIALGFAITLICYLDRSALSWAITPIKKEFGFTDQDFGAIASSFGIGYMIMTVGGGIVVDKWGARKVWPAAAILWSGCTALMGLASNFWLFYLFRMMLGVAEGPHFPALTRVVADWLPLSERGRATAIGLSAVPISMVIGAPLLSNMVASLGWKVMFGILGCLGFAWAAVWYVVFRDYPEECKLVSDSELNYIREGKVGDRKQSSAAIRHAELSGGATTWRFMLSNPSLMSNNVAFFSFGYLLFFALTWLPGYLEQTYHLHVKEAGIYSIAPWLTAGILLPSAGWLSDYLLKKTGSYRASRTHMIWMCQLASALCFVPLMFSPSLELAITMISLGLGLGLMPNAAFYALNCDLAKDRVGTSLGIMDCFFAVAGVLAPWFTGVIATATNNFSAAFGVLIAFTLISVVSVVIFQKPDGKTSS